MAFLERQPKLTEGRFMRQVRRYAELMRWRVYHTHDSRRSAAGFPDLVLVRPPRLVFIELKGDRTPVTDAQRAWIAALRACEAEAYVFRPTHIDAIMRVLR